MLSLIKKILTNSPRQLIGEKKTRMLIVDFLNQINAPFSIQNFVVKIPQPKKYFLLADKQKIKCSPCAFKSGRIESKKYLSNALRDSASKHQKAIIFNPKCKDISLHTFYFAPALAISPKDVPKILKAKKILGYVKIKKISHQTANILIGNTKNPQYIIFAHYDSIGTGAVDNASGTAVVLKTIQKKFPKNNLFVLSGCEELSFDEPIYWGHGYRVFEKDYYGLLEKCRKIIIVDSVGNGKLQIFDKKELEIIKLGFPIQNLEEFKNKVYCITGNPDKLMEVYHSELDALRQIKIKYLNQAYIKLQSLIDN
jgi:hypothetical protein